VWRDLPQSNPQANGSNRQYRGYGFEMWVEAIVSLEDFQSLAAELFPVRVHLGADSDHYLFLSAMSEVSLVEGRGLRLVCNAQIRWPVLGMDVPINVERLAVMLEPSVPNEGGELCLGVQLEHADVAWVPALLDTKIVGAINEALQKRRADLSWNFAKTLSHELPLPEMLQPLRALDLKAAWGKTRVTNEGVVLVVSFHAHAIPKDPAQTEAAYGARPPSEPAARLPASRRPALVPAFPTPSDRPSPAAVALGTTVAIVGTYALARLGYGLISGRRGYRFA
jgi:hypothetical protein